MTEEIWKPVVGYEGFYEVSSFGNIKSLSGNHFKDDRVIKTFLSTSGYPSCGLSKMRVRTLFMVHTIVAISFLNHKPNGHTLVVDHINGDRTDNRVENLRIVSHRYNSSSGFRKDRINMSSKFPGVYLYKATGKWAASINSNKKLHHIGYYDNEIEAHEAYNRELFKLKQNIL